MDCAQASLSDTTGRRERTANCTSMLLEAKQVEITHLHGARLFDRAGDLLYSLAVFVIGLVGAKADGKISLHLLDSASTPLQR